MGSIWNNFIITEEQRLKMEAGDREAIERFYFENYVFLFYLARKYASAKHRNGDFRYNAEDMMQDLYIALFDPYKFKFSSCTVFRLNLNNLFSCSAFPNAWTCISYSYEREVTPNPLYIVDQYKFDGNSDKPIIDSYVSTPEPYFEIMRVKERIRKERLEEDLQIFLGEILTEWQLDQWNKGYIHPSTVVKLRKNANVIISILRKHGVPSRKLEGIVRSSCLKDVYAEVKEGKATKYKNYLQNFDALPSWKQRKIRNAKWYKEMMREAGSAL